mgnify:CR=1 FL=1
MLVFSSNRENFKLRLEGMLGFIDVQGSEGFDDSKIEELEALISECDSKMTGQYKDQVSDSIYDVLYDMLKRVKPDSYLLMESWEEDGDITDYTELLQSNPMMSIETAKSYDCKALQDFIERMPEDTESYFASYKLNGHGIRVVYQDGVLVSATSRGRSAAKRDITDHLKLILGEVNDNLSDYGMVELRGELVLPTSKLDEARSFNPEIKSAFSAVSSLIRPSATSEEVKLLEFVCYGFIVDGFSFTDREEEFNLIEESGFVTPWHMSIEEADRENLLETIQLTVQAFEENYENFGYFCDGVVFEISDREKLNSFGTEGNHMLGNIALKVGVWEQVQYCGYVNKLVWTKGKSKLSPVAIVGSEPNIIPEDMIDVEDSEKEYYNDLGVLTAQGNKVRRVPLYEPKNILTLEAYIGKPIYFRYGGEAGVVPCFPDGRLLKEDAAREILLGEEWYEI